jgi:geranylgeranyl reductase family protein
VIDVAIVGGGPAGLLSASLLAESGLEVLVLENHHDIGTPTHCTGVASLEIAEFVKIPDEIILGDVTRARLVGPGGGYAEAGWDVPAKERLFVLDRAAFDRSLAGRAAGSGASVLTGTRVDDIEVARDRVSLHASGRRIEAQVCVLACGVSYRFQRRLGLGLPGHIIHTAQLEVGAEPAEGVELYFGRSAAPDGFVWTVPIVREGRSRLKLGAMARGNAAEYLTAFLRRPEVRDRLREAPGDPIRRLLPLKPLPRTYTDRVLAVGDAGGFTKPTTGGGIFYSLLTASLAAATLVEAFQAGRFDEAFLAGYERAWNDRLGQELRVADWLRGRLTRLTDAEIDRMIAAAASNDVQALVQRTARFNWHRDVIVALLRQPGIGALLARSLFR